MGYSVSYIYEVVDRYSNRLEKINRVTRKFEKRIKGARTGLKQMSSRLTGFQGALSSVVGVMGAAGIGRTFLTFEQSMNKLGSVALANNEQMAALRTTAKQLGKTTQFSASEAANAMVFLKMAGLSVAQVLKAIPGTLQLAAAGGIELSQAADIATNVLAQMGFEVKELSRVNDVLAFTQANANTNISELFEAMRPVAVTAKNLGIELEELAASLGVMANAGEKGSIAGTLLRNALTRMVGAGKSQRALYRDLGIDLRNFIDSAGKIKNFTAFIGKLKDVEKTGRLTVSVMQKLFGKQGFRSIQILAGAGAEQIGRLDNALKKAGGTAEKMALIQMQGLPGVVKAFASAWESVQIALFESGFVDLIIDLGNKFTQLMRGIVDANPQVLKFAAIAGALLIALGPIVLIVGSLAAAIGALLSPVGAVIAGIGTLIAIATTLWSTNENIRDAVTNLFGSFKRLLSVFKPIVSLFGWLLDSVGGSGAVWDKIAAGINTVSIALDAITWPMRTVIELFSKLMTSGFVGAVGRLAGAFGSVLGLGGMSKADQVSAAVKARNSFLSGQKLTGAAVNKNITADRSAFSGSLNGSISVSAEPGTRVNSATVQSTLPGDLGMNMGY